MQRQPGQRYNKACDSCHVSKVRCVPLDPLQLQQQQQPGPPTVTPGAVCRRCSKNGVSCVFSPVGPRRRPVRTKNERIAELERRVRDMQLKLEKEVEKRTGGSAAVLAEDDDNNNDDDVEGEGESEVDVETEEARFEGQHEQRHADDREEAAAHAGGVPVSPPKDNALNAQLDLNETAAGHDSDLIDRGVLTEAQADRLFHEFRLHLDNKFITVSLPPGVPSRRLRRESPVFWLSVLCAASSGTSNADLLALGPVLFAEMQTLLDRLLPKHSSHPPTIDLLQGLMSYMIFQYHDAAFPYVQQLLGVFRSGVTIVLDMAANSKLHCLPDLSLLSEDDITDKDIQLSRELLRWYWLSLSVLVKNREPELPQVSMLRQSHVLEASRRIVETTHTKSDAGLLQWIKLAKVAVVAIRGLYHGHTHTQGGGLSGEARDEILDTFEKDWRKWLVECPFDLVNEPLMLEYHYLYLLVSEFIHAAGVVDFSRRRFGLPSLDTSSALTHNSTDNFFAPYKIGYTRRCIKAAHACLELATKRTAASADNPNLYTTRTTPDTDLFRRFGVLPYSRIFYALRFLLLVMHEAWRTKSYETVDVDALRVHEYMAALKDCLQAASAGGKYRGPTLWLYALRTRIAPWYTKLRGLVAKDRPAASSPNASWPASPVDQAPLADSTTPRAGAADANAAAFSPFNFGNPLDFLPSSGGTDFNFPTNSLVNLLDTMNHASLYPNNINSKDESSSSSRPHFGNDHPPPLPHTIGSQSVPASPWAEDLYSFAFTWGHLSDEHVPGADDLFEFSQHPNFSASATSDATHEAAADGKL